MLVHGRTYTVADTFGTASKPLAVRRLLQDAGLYICECNYKSCQGPSQNITGQDNKLAEAVNRVLEKMNKIGTDEVRQSFGPISGIRGTARNIFETKSIVDIDHEETSLI